MRFESMVCNNNVMRIISHMGFPYLINGESTKQPPHLQSVPDGGRHGSPPKRFPFLRLPLVNC